MDYDEDCSNAQCQYMVLNLRKQVKTIEEEWSQYEDSWSKMQAQLEDAERNCNRLKLDNNKYRSQEKTLQEAVDAAEEKYVQVEKRLQIIVAENSKLISFNAELQELHNVDRNEVDKLFKQLKDCRESEMQLKRAYDTAEAERERLDQKVTMLSCENRAIRREKDELSAINSELVQMEKEREQALQEMQMRQMQTPQHLFAEVTDSQIDTPFHVKFRRLEFDDLNNNSPVQFIRNDTAKSLLEETTPQIDELKKKDRLLKSLQKRMHHLKNQIRRSRSLNIRNRGVRGESGGESTAEESVVTVVVKDGVQTGQPRVHVIQTTSIATQTEKVDINAAAVQTNGIEEALDSPSESETDSDSSGSYAGFADDGASPPEPDMYRSCRKLSVLLEEEGDESGLHRNSSVRSNLSARLCTSADDVLASIRQPPLRTGKHVSCADILLAAKQPPSISYTEPEPLSPSNASLLDPTDAFHQPHSFDSYLDPQQIPCLPRQISDPTQNAVSSVSVVRRGSFVKRPRSTCRPLTLTCDTSDTEERVPKVRFDLTEKKPDELISPPRELVLVSKLKPTKNFSRFRVELVDEDQLELDQEELRVRPHLHSVVYKKSVLHDLTPSEAPKTTSSPLVVLQDDPTPMEDMEMSPYGEGSYLLDDIYPCKRRKESNVSCTSVESEAGIMAKSIRLHEKGECIVMRDLSGDTSSETDIPYIDAEELAEIVAEVSKTTQTDVSCMDTISYSNSPMGSIDEDMSSPTNSSLGPDVFTSSPSVSSTGTFCTAVTELTPLKEDPPKLSKSPTVLKNLASFESYDSPDVKHRLLPKSVLEEEDEISEGSDTMTYVTVKSDPLVFISDCESDTYVTVKSDLNTCSEDDSDTYGTIKSHRSSCLERKPSDLSDHSNSPYNTPPDSTASFFTPPDTCSPLFMKSKKYLRMYSGSSTPSPRDTRSSSPARVFRSGNGQSNNSSFNYDTPPSSASPYTSPSKICQANEFDNECAGDRRRSSEATFSTNAILFDSPKLEFYEPNDSVENLEAFLETEEGLRNYDAPIKRNSLDSATDGRFGEKRMKRHPPLSRQNSTEEYIYLEPQDSSLNLSEEMSSPSTTPDTSNKTVIFKNKPLTVSNTIDLDDDDFPISESEIIINLNGSQSEIMEIPLMQTCRSEPCIPSMGKLSLARLNRQSCSMSEEPDSGSNYPAIVISTVSSESEDIVLPADLQAILNDIPTPSVQPRPPCPLPEASLSYF